MTIEERISELKEALKPLPDRTQTNDIKEKLAKLEKLKEMKERFIYLENQFDKLSTPQCCDLLGCDRVTFLKYRVRLKVAGGTPENPLFNRADIMKLKVLFASGKRH
jgi:hypothetical protein